MMNITTHQEFLDSFSGIVDKQIVLYFIMKVHVRRCFDYHVFASVIEIVARANVLE